MGSVIAEAIIAVRRRVYDIPAVFADTVNQREGTERPVDRVQACAHATKLARRERPRLYRQWRMCPSA